MGGVDDRAMEIDGGGTASGKEKLPLPLPEPKRKRDRNPELAWDWKAVKALHMDRSQQFSEYDPKERDCIPTCSFDVEKEPRAGSPIPEYTSSDGSGNMGDLDERRAMEIEGGGAAAGKEKLPLPEPEPEPEPKLEPEPEPKPLWQSYLELTWEEKAVEVLDLVRRRQITEYDPKQYGFMPTHFCNHNIAFFDFEKESEAGRGPPLHTLTSFDLEWMEHSVNVISLNVLESDVGFPISIFGTVVARDQIDYRCVYLFKRDRDDSQLITSPEDMLTLTGPYRGLAVTDSMFFEINLKIKCDGTVDRDFSKVVLEHNAIFHTRQPRTCLLPSRMSTVELVYTPVPHAMEATLAVNVLKGPCDFTGKVTAWTTGDDENHVILYDSEAAGTLTVTGAGGSVALTRHLVTVPFYEELVLDICVFDGDREDERFELTLGHSDDERTCKQGSYELQVKVAWTGMVERRRDNMLGVRGCYGERMCDVKQKSARNNSFAALDLEFALATLQICPHDLI